MDLLLAAAGILVSYCVITWLTLEIMEWLDPTDDDD